VHVGDVVTHIDKQKIEGAADVVDYVSGQKVATRSSSRSCATAVPPRYRSPWRIAGAAG